MLLVFLERKRMVCTLARRDLHSANHVCRLSFCGRLRGATHRAGVSPYNHVAQGVHVMESPGTCVCVIFVFAMCCVFQGRESRGITRHNHHGWEGPGLLSRLVGCRSNRAALFVPICCASPRSKRLQTPQWLRSCIGFWCSIKLIEALIRNLRS